MSEETLLFVYNANADLFSTVTDFAHKMLSPSTYQCQLCALTYGHFTEKQEWKQFLAHLPLPAKFLHKDEFQQQFHRANALPAVFHLKGSKLQEIISTEELHGCQTLPDLQHLVLQKL